MKILIVLLLVLQVFSQQRKIKLNYLNDIIIPKLPSGSTSGDITVSLLSLQDNDDTVQITVQLIQSSDLTKPLDSVVVNTAPCNFVSLECSVTFTESLSTTSRYAIRLAESTQIHSVDVRVSLGVTDALGSTSTLNAEKVALISPYGADSPGFKFMASDAGTWTVQLAMASSPAPTITSYDLNLYSVSANVLTLISSKSLTAVGSSTFDIPAGGQYYLTVDLAVSYTDAKTKYPIVMDLTFGDITCLVGKYFDKPTKTCVDCSTVANSAVSSTVGGICDCLTTYFWTGSICKACPPSGCPTPGVKNEKPEKPPAPDKPAKPETNGNIKKDGA